jgi:SAM-dependent methyltransferase
MPNSVVEFFLKHAWYVTTMNGINQFHTNYVFDRRVRTLSQHLGKLIPDNARVLDVGSGDGRLAQLIVEKRADVTLEGIDVLKRAHTYIPVTLFDGQMIPFDDNRFETVMFVDILHHTDDPTRLLREAARVACKSILIKDHILSGVLAGPTLRFMDWFGNARYGVALPYNYWPRSRWLEVFQTLNVKVGVWKEDLGIYPIPADWIFGRSLHFIARLDLQ